MKEFIKPTKVKIILALILTFIFTPFVLVYDGNRSGGCNINSTTSLGCPYALRIFISVQSLPSFFLSYGVSFYSISKEILIIGLVITYLISCFVVWLINYWRSWNWIKKIIFSFVFLLIFLLILGVNLIINKLNKLWSF